MTHANLTARRTNVRSTAFRLSPFGVPPSCRRPAKPVENTINAQLKKNPLNRAHPTTPNDLTSHSSKRTFAHLRNPLLSNSPNHPKNPLIRSPDHPQSHKNRKAMRNLDHLGEHRKSGADERCRMLRRFMPSLLHFLTFAGPAQRRPFTAYVLQRKRKGEGHEEAMRNPAAVGLGFPPGGRGGYRVWCNVPSSAALS